MSAIRLDGNGSAATWGEAVDRCAKVAPREPAHISIADLLHVPTAAELRANGVHPLLVGAIRGMFAEGARMTREAFFAWMPGVADDVAHDATMRLLVSAAVAEGLFGWLR